MRRLLINIALYFAIVPTAYVMLIGFTDPHPVSSTAWPLYYIFTTPSWVAIVAVIPLLALAVKTVPGITGWSPRIVSIFAGALLLGAPASLLTWAATVTFAVAGAIYGALWKL